MAEQLGETERGPRGQIGRIVKGAGIDFAREVYQLTLDTEAQGGLLLPDGGWGVFLSGADALEC